MTVGRDPAAAVTSGSVSLVAPVNRLVRLASDTECIPPGCLQHLDIYNNVTANMEQA
jgi:hypothetical protein